MRVWITRARPEAEDTAARLRALGWAPLTAPLLEIRPLSSALAAPLELDGAGALAFTSRNGVRALAGSTVPAAARRDLPAYAVGAATAEAAREAGFGDVRSAEGDLGALIARILADPARPPGEILHIAPRKPAGDLVGALRQAGVPARRAVLYEAAPLPPSAEALEAWPALAAVLLHSPEAARRLLDAAPPLPGPPLLCISENAAAPLRARFAHVRAAAEPTEAALLALLGKPARPE